MEAGSYKDALSLLEKSLKMNQQVLGASDISNASIFMEISKVFVKNKNYELALDNIGKAWELADAKYGKDHAQVAEIFVETANIYHKQKKFADAIDNQKRALDVYENLQNFQDQDTVAQVCITLSEWQENYEENVEAALESLKKAEKIFEYAYGVVDKKTCKVKRNISLLYLKNNQYSEALEELREVEELEKTLYGEQSMQLGKTYKVIGTLYIINNNPDGARQYLMAAHQIFESKGFVKLLKEVKNKLKMLNSSVKMAQEAAEKEGINDSGEDSGAEGSPVRGTSATKKLAAKKKKGVKKGKKMVIKNNFV